MDQLNIIVILVPLEVFLIITVIFHVHKDIMKTATFVKNVITIVVVVMEILLLVLVVMLVLI